MRTTFFFVAGALTSCLANDAACANEDVVSFDAAYIADVWHNSGGIRDGSRYLDNFSLAAEIALEELVGWKDAVATVSLLYNNGQSLSELTGDSLVKSNIETGVEALRLYDAWIAFPVGSQSNLKVGLYDLNSEFDVLESSGLFIGSAHGIGMDIAQTGENGPSIFPITGFAARFETQFTENSVLRFAAIDGVPGDPDDPKSFKVDFSEDEGVLLIGELDIGDADGRVLAGAWRYSEPFTTNDGAAQENNTGLYLRGEKLLSTHDSGVLRGFARAGLAASSVNQYDQFYSAGLTFERENDTFGFAYAQARTGDAWKAANGDSADAEEVFELTYARGLTDWLEIQPNVQYVLNPSADRTVDDALAIGLRMSINPSFLLTQ